MQLTILPLLSFFFFFNDTATTEIYTLSLHDALPILILTGEDLSANPGWTVLDAIRRAMPQDRKSTRLNSSHLVISYAVFCLKKKNWAVTMAATLIRIPLIHHPTSQLHLPPQNRVQHD